MLQNRINIFDKFSMTSKQMRLCCSIKLKSVSGCSMVITGCGLWPSGDQKDQPNPMSLHTHKNIFYKIHCHVPQSLLCSLNSPDLRKMPYPRKTFQSIKLGVFLKDSWTLVLKILFYTFLFSLLSSESRASKQ